MKKTFLGLVALLLGTVVTDAVAQTVNSSQRYGAAQNIVARNISQKIEHEISAQMAYSRAAGGPNQYVGKNYQPTPEQAQDVFVRMENLLDQLPQKQSEFYREKLDTVKLDNGLPDVSDVNTMKAYLAGYKLLKYFPNEIPRIRISHFAENSNILGAYAADFRELEKKFGGNWAYKWLTKVLYDENRFKMLSLDFRDEIEPLAWEMLYSLGEKELGVSKQWMSLFMTDAIMEDFRSVTYIADLDNPQNDWNAQVILAPIFSKEKGKYFPVALCALHELLHVQNFFPGVLEAEEEKYVLTELPNSIRDIMLADILYKEVLGIDLMTEVEYPNVNSAVDYGKLAVFFHKLAQKYPDTNITALLLKPEVTQYFQELYMPPYK